MRMAVAASLGRLRKESAAVVDVKRCEEGDFRYTICVRTGGCAAAEDSDVAAWRSGDVDPHGFAVRQAQVGGKRHCSDGESDAARDVGECDRRNFGRVSGS
jgi:hypothetical protein